ncbi:MAG: SMC-Scp complex subunit ScpB [Ignavibacteriota bacterium]|nr:SMC-Scp complex subunit ScpB [Ignavibacteriota bacterium]
MEALIFASEEEITTKEIKDLLDSFKISVSLKEIDASIEELNVDYEQNSNAFEILKIAGGYVFATRKKFSHFLGKLSAETQRKKLSQSAIETLAIIAYKQPITRTEIEFVRGVNVDYIVNSLLERDLITIKGRADGPGRPILYGTTASFLKVLGLNALEDLPKLKEINDILKNEKIEGISEADIDLFNSMSIQAQAELTNNPKTDDTGELKFNEETESTNEEQLTEETDVNQEDTEIEEEDKTEVAEAEETHLDTIEDIDVFEVEDTSDNNLEEDGEKEDGNKKE